MPPIAGRLQVHTRIYIEEADFAFDFTNDNIKTINKHISVS